MFSHPQVPLLSQSPAPGLMIHLFVPLSARVSQSQIWGSHQFLLPGAMMTRQTGINEGWFLLIDWYKPICCIGILLPLFVLFKVHLYAWLGFGSDPPESQSVQTRFWEEADALAIKYKQHPSVCLGISLYLYSFIKCKISICFIEFYRLMFHTFAVLCIVP